MYFCSRIIHITVIKLILIIKLMIMEISELYSIFKKHPVVTTDSRDCPQGSIFVALKGESFDGNRFAAAALEKVVHGPWSTRPNMPRTNGAYL